MSSARRLRIGLAAYGTGWDLEAWRLPGATNSGLLDPSVIVDVARIAERGKLDYVFSGSALATEPNRLNRVFRWDNSVYAGTLAAVTEHVGFFPSYNTSFEHPYFVARQIATADRFSAGRIGVNLVYGIDREGGPAGNFGGWPLPDDQSKYDRADEFTEVLFRLLHDSWEHDLLLDDRDGGTLIRPDSWHPIDFVGKHFQVRGPLNAPPPVQPKVPLIHVGESARSLELGIRHAEVRFSPYYGFEEGKRRYQQVKHQVAEAGRDPDKFLIIPGITFFVAGTKREAREKFNDAHRVQTEEVIPAYFSKVFGVDLAGVRASSRAADVLPLERLHGDALKTNQTGGLAREASTVKRGGLDDAHWLHDLLAKRLGEDLTLAELYHAVQSHLHGEQIFVGDTAGFADWLEANFVERVFDGIQLFPPYHRGPADFFVDNVVPELQRRGLFRREYESRLLAENLGIA
nr:LLM class flavin-dependent oxidoreductase [Dactylosporangium thailandense]